MAATVTAQVGIGSVTPATTIETASLTPTGTNKVIYALVGCGATAPGSPNSVKYASTAGVGGEAMTLLDSVRTVNTNMKTSVWFLANPVAASGTVWAQYAATNDERWIIAEAVQDAAGTNTTPIYATANGTNSPSVVSTGNTAGELVLDFLSVLDTGGNTPTIAVGAGQTSIKELEGAVAGANGIGINEAAGTSRETAAGANTTMSWTISVVADWGIHTFQVNPAAAASSGSPSAIKQIYVMP